MPADRALLLDHHWSGRRASHLLGYSLVAPIVVIMAGVILVPVVGALVTSFQDQRTIGSSSAFVGFQNYLTVFQDGEFWAAMRRSLIWLVLNMVVQTILAFGAAILMQGRGWWARSARIWMMLPWVVPTAAVAVIWQWLVNSNYGIVYKFFGYVGIDLGAPFGDPSKALLAVIFVNSWHWFPLTAVVVYGGLATIPGEVLEAARIDGANAWQTFRSVTFPLLQPVLLAVALVGSLWSINVLDTIYLITKGGPVGATTTLPAFVYIKAFNAFRASEAAAASILTVVVLAIAAGLFVRFTRASREA
jgi:multiple sugar transport system permease protein